MIIALSGKLQSGKDTLARYLLELLPGYEPKQFAEKLKLIVSIMTGAPLRDMATAEGKQRYLPAWKMTVGEMLQRVGTDAVRNHVHVDGWVLATFAYYTPQSNWIITDCRFPNEAEAVKSRGGILIRVNRARRDTAGRDTNHPSETALDNYAGWDFTVDNNGTLEDLQTIAQGIANVVTQRNS